MVDLTDAIKPKSDQLNSDDLISGPITIKITKVSKGDDKQKIKINFDGDNGKPYKPCKSMCRLMVKMWGKDGLSYEGKTMTLYCDQTVMFAGQAVGGIRISHMSDIGKDQSVLLTASKGSKKPHNVKNLVVKKSRSVAEIISDGKKASDKATWFKSLSQEDGLIAKKHRDEINKKETEDDLEDDFG